MRRKKIAILVFSASLLGASSLCASPSEAELRQSIVEGARKYLGVPYVYGAESPSAFDCSGFVQYVYLHAADMNIPRSSSAQAEAGKRVDKEDMKPGDLFFFDTVGGGKVSHVAIFLGGASMIHAVSEGPKTGVVITPIPDGYFSKRFVGARYFIVSAVPATPAPAPQPKPQPAPKPAPKQAAAPSTPEIPISQIGVRVAKAHDIVEDPIPAAAGTGIAFTITNDTGKDQLFHVTFYKTGAKYVVLREDRAMVKAGGSQELSAYIFAEPGVYRLNVKTADNTQMMQRAWKVIELK